MWVFMGLKVKLYKYTLLHDYVQNSYLFLLLSELSNIYSLTMSFLQKVDNYSTMILVEERKESDKTGSLKFPMSILQ